MERFTKPKVDKYINLYSKYANPENFTYSTEGFVSSVNITNQGFYYDDGILNYFDSENNPIPEYPPSVVFSAPQTGSDTTTGTAIIDGGRLVGINITNNGSGYTSPPSITITSQTWDESNGDLVEAEGIAYIYPTDENGNYAINGTGEGYSMDNPPSVTIDLPQHGHNIQATAEVVEIIDGKITIIQVLNAGNGYYTLPNVTITGGDGTGATAKALFYLGTGATATANLSYEPDVIFKYSWELESPIEINENALISVVDRQFENIPSGDLNKPIVVRMFEIGTKSIVNCKNTSSNKLDTFYQGRIIDMGLPERSIKNDIKLEINQQMIDKITLSLNHGLTSSLGLKYDTDFVIILKVEEIEPKMIEYGNLNNINISQ